MAKLKWDASGEHYYETGVKNGVLYVQDDDGTYPKGVAWNGLTAVTQSPSGAEATALYADDIKYLNLYSTEEFAATIEAYTYPDEFAKCDGSYQLVDGVDGVYVGQQTRKAFGLAYKTVLGNDLKNNKYGYKIHLIYGAMAAPSEKAYATINDSPEAITFSWELSTTPISIDGELNATSYIEIDSTKLKDQSKLQQLENMLFGSESGEAELPLPSEIIKILKTEG
jgi:hypothetical protein